MINENKSSYYPEIYPYKKGVYSPYNKLCVIRKNNMENNKETYDEGGKSDKEIKKIDFGTREYAEKNA